MGTEGRRLPERASHHPGVLGRLAEGPWRFHVVGAGGAGMNAIALILLKLGHMVSGSDEKPSTALERLAGAGARVWVGHNAHNVQGADAVVHSSAITATNVELAQARDLGLPVYGRAEVLAAICSLKRTLAVSGTHGKTTTTAMLSVVLEAAGMRPSYLVGGDLPGGRGGALWSDGDLFVVEADESDGTFLTLPASGALVTSIEPDHMDFFGDMATLEEAFWRFSANAAGPRVICVSDPASAALAARLRNAGATEVLTYGHHGPAGPRPHTRPEFAVSGARLEGFGSTFELDRAGVPLGRFRLRVPGMHNILDAVGALAMAAGIGAPLEEAREALASFTGVGRRFERKGEAGGVLLVDDYAHNPGKVAAVLGAAKATGARRVVAVFQPHRYTRTAALWRELGEALSRADIAVVTDVYGAGEVPIDGVSSQLVVEAARQAATGATVISIPSRNELLEQLPLLLAPGDLCLTIGAGDITTLAAELAPRLAAGALPVSGAGCLNPREKGADQCPPS